MKGKLLMKYHARLIALFVGLIAVIGCGDAPTNLYGGIIPPMPDPDVAVCTDVNYPHNDTGNGLNPAIQPSVYACPGRYPDPRNYACAACVWSPANYTLASTGEIVTAYPTPLPPLGCWLPTGTDVTQAVICFDSCDIAATVCR